MTKPHIKKPARRGDRLKAKATKAATSTTTSNGKKVLEDMDKTLMSMEMSREDLFSVTKSLVEALEALNSRLLTSETENILLTERLLESNAACKALQEDVLRLHQANTDEEVVAASSENDAEVEQLKEQLRLQLMMSSEKKKTDCSPDSQLSQLLVLTMVMITACLVAVCFGFNIETRNGSPDMYCLSLSTSFPIADKLFTRNPL